MPNLPGVCPECGSYSRYICDLQDELATFREQRLPEVPCCPVHETLWKAGNVKPFDNCFVCIRNQRDELLETLGKIYTEATGDSQFMGERIAKLCDSATTIPRPDASESGPARESPTERHGESQTVNHWEVSYPCGCNASSNSVDAPPNYCPDHEKE